MDKEGLKKEERERFARIVEARFWEVAEELEAAGIPVDERLYEAVNDGIRDGLGEFASEAQRHDPGALIDICKKIGITHESRRTPTGHEERWVCSVCGDGPWQPTRVRDAHDAIRAYAWPVHHVHARDKHAAIS
jgi:hypothetical protein